MPRLTSTFLLLLFVLFPAFTSELPSDAAKYVAQSEDEIMKVRKALLVNLNKTMVKATKAGDLDAANAIKTKVEEIEKLTAVGANLLTPAPIDKKMAGDYFIKTPGWSGVWIINEDGTSVCGPVKGTWTLTGKEMSVVWDSGKSGKITLADKGSQHTCLLNNGVTGTADKR